MKNTVSTKRADGTTEIRTYVNGRLIDKQIKPAPCAPYGRLIDNALDAL